MEKYSIITQRTGCHILIDSLLRSIKRNLNPDEVLVYENRFVYSRTNVPHGKCVNEKIHEAKNRLVLLLDHDILILDSKIINEMIEKMKDENVFCCTPFDYPFEGEDLPTPQCVMINKDLFLKNGIEFGCGGNPGWNTFKNAKNAFKQEIIKIDSGKSVFHLERGGRIPYYQLILNNFFKDKFEIWKKDVSSNANFEDYVIDDGMNLLDNEWLVFEVLSNLNDCINKRKPFSTIRLGDLGLRYLYDYFFNEKDFTHVGFKHPDLAIPNDKIGRKLIEELIESMKKADYIDHPDLYKGALSDLYKWRGILDWADEVYNKARIINNKTKFCSSLQGYLSFVFDFELNLYDIMKGRKILYVGPHDSLEELNRRNPFQPKELGFYQLSLSNDFNERYEVMNNFTKNFDPNYWDLVLVTGSLYGRTIIGRIKKMGGRAFDLGQAISFNPNNIFEPSIKQIKDHTYYEIIDHFVSGEKDGR